mmetsp:Transcript_67563/g.188531  ORF Transcript_67563/g.188531 Transcript_67563/m.188531 type:complete len:459 (+) Transcript_67563:66-1442(+)
MAKNGLAFTCNGPGSDGRWLSPSKAVMAVGEQSERNAAVVRGYIDGCFDIMHSGHYNAIRQAKSICDHLVVGVHSDLEIELNKALPVMKQEERYALLEHIKWIDEIVHDVPYSPHLSTLELARADFCVHGDDMPVNAQGVCAYDEMKHAGKLRIVKRTEGVSTTDLIGRLLTLSRDHLTQRGAQTPEPGYKFNADVVAGYCTQAGLKPASLAFVEELAAKYNMHDEDLERLRVTVGGTSEMNSQCSNLLATPPDSGRDRLRTIAPVQLLASTRRISEFASGRQPSGDDRVVYVGGSFDMFHVGHAQFLKDARALGTFLLVGIYDDCTVSRSKGVGLPVMSLSERILNVCACKWVDEAIIGAPRDVTDDLIATWGIHIVARGVGHMRNADLSPRDQHMVPKKWATFHQIQSRWPDVCHETIVRRISERRTEYLARNSVRALKEDEYYASKEQTASPLEA